MLAVLAGLMWPFLGIVLGVAAAVYAHAVGFKTARNVLLLLVALGLIGLVLFGAGGNVEGGIID